MGDWDHIGKGVVNGLATILTALIVSVPLALWKLWDIGVWFVHHFAVTP